MLLGGDIDDPGSLGRSPGRRRLVDLDRRLSFSRGRASASGGASLRGSASCSASAGSLGGSANAGDSPVEGSPFESPKDSSSAGSTSWGAAGGSGGGGASLEGAAGGSGAEADSGGGGGSGGLFGRRGGRGIEGLLSLGDLGRPGRRGGLVDDLGRLLVSRRRGYRGAGLGRRFAAGRGRRRNLRLIRPRLTRAATQPLEQPGAAEGIRPVTRAERLVLEIGQLPVAGAVALLQLKVIAYGVVEYSHRSGAVDSAKGKRFRASRVGVLRSWARSPSGEFAHGRRIWVRRGLTERQARFASTTGAVLT